MANLSELNLSVNFASKFANESFASLTGLKVIDLSEMCLTIVNKKLLVGLGSLQRLCLANNQLTEIEMKALGEHLNKVTELDLHGNFLPTVS